MYLTVCILDVLDYKTLQPIVTKYERNSQVKSYQHATPRMKLTARVVLRIQNRRKLLILPPSPNQLFR
jgi:hypothetical protein